MDAGDRADAHLQLEERMRPQPLRSGTAQAPGTAPGERATCGWLVFSWTLAGGVALGGILVSLLTIAGMVAPGLQLLAAPVLFLLGSFLGAVHGGLLAVVGRPRGLSRGVAIRAAAKGFLLGIPALFPAWVVTAGISLTAALVAQWRPTWAVASLGAWFFGLALCGWAAHCGWAALRRAYVRWPESRAGSILTGGILVAACVAALRTEPHVWGTDLRLNGVGALLAALALTLWVGFPLVFVVLRLAHGWLPPHVGGGEAGSR